MELSFDLAEWASRAREILLKPQGFFAGTKKEKGIKKALSFFLVLSLVGTVFSVVGVSLFSRERLIGTGGILFFALLSFVTSLVGSFVSALFLFLWLKLFRSRRNFEKAYQLFVYSRTPGQLLGWVPILNIFIFFYGLYLIVIGTEEYYGFARRKAILVYIAPILVILALALLGFGFFSTNFQT